MRDKIIEYLRRHYAVNDALEGAVEEIADEIIKITDNGGERKERPAGRYEALGGGTEPPGFIIWKTKE